MRSFGLLLVCSAVACGGSGKSGGTAPRAPLTAKDIVTQSTPAIVRIEAGDGAGTGFIVDQSGLVATNLHVVAGNDAVKVKLHDGSVFPVQAVAGIDPHGVVIRMDAVAAIRAKRLAAILRPVQRDSTQKNVVLVTRINANEAEVHGAGIDAVDARPGLAAVSGLVDAAVLVAVGPLPVLDVFVLPAVGAAIGAPGAGRAGSLGAPLLQRDGQVGNQFATLDA